MLSRGRIGAHFEQGRQWSPIRESFLPQVGVESSSFGRRDRSERPPELQVIYEVRESGGSSGHVILVKGRTQETTSGFEAIWI